MSLDRTLTVSRVINAPVARVFAAFIGPDIDAWWGPDGYVNTTFSRDVRPGGAWIYEMRHAQHGVFPNRVRYVTIVPNERMTYLHDAGVDDGSAMDVTITFRDLGGKTELTLSTVLPTVEALEAAKGFGAVEGGRQTLARLAAHVE